MISEKDFWIVKILPEEQEMIIKSGNERNENGKSLGWQTKATSHQSDDHIIGYAGEYAASLVTGIKISQTISSSVKVLNQGDLGNKIEVKTRKDKSNRLWDLAVNEDKNLIDDKIYILCLAMNWPENIIVAGWEFGGKISEEGTKMKHRNNGHSFLIYPYKMLRPIKTIFDHIRRM